MQNESTTGERDDTELDADFALFQRRGDAAALARVFDRAAPRLLLLAAHFARDAAEAEDLVQTTFLHAVRDAATWERERPVAAWLAGILRHRALDLLRARRRRPERELPDLPLAAAAADPADLAQQRDLFERVVAAADAIDEPFRAVLLMRLVHGLEPTAIAHTLGRAPGTVRMQLKRGLEKLRAALPSAEALLGGAFGAVVLGESARGLEAVREAVLASSHGAATSTPLVPGATASSFGVPSAVLGVAVALVSVVLGALFVLSSDEPHVGTPISATSPSSAIVATSTATTSGASTANGALEADASVGRQSVAANVPAESVATTTNESAAGATGTVLGRILLPDGTPSPGPWRVSAEVHGERATDDRGSYFEYAPWDPASGAFRFDALAVGPVEISVVSPDGVLDALPKAWVTVLADQVLSRDFVDEGPAAATRLVVKTSCAPGRGLGRPRLEHLRIVDEAGVEHVPSRHWHQMARWLFEGLTASTYTLVIDDPDFERIELPGLATGATHAVELVGSQRIDVAVTGPTGEPIALALVELELVEPFDESTRTMEFIQSASTDSSGRATLWTRRDAQRMHVTAASHAPWTREFAEGFAQGATPVAIELKPALSIRGRVLQPDGRPVPGVEVRCRPSTGPTPREENGHFVSVMWPGNGRDDSIVTRADADGAFELGPLADGLYDVGAALRRETDTTAFDVPAGTPSLQLVTPAFGSLTVRLDPLPPALARFLKDDLVFHQPIEARVQLPQRQVDDAPRMWSVCYGTAEPQFDASGRCELVHLPAGVVPMTVELPGAHVPKAYGGQSFNGPTIGPFEVNIEPGGSHELVVDLSAYAFATVHVSVTNGSAPGTGLVVVGRRVDGAAPHDRAHAAGVCDENGVASLEPVYAGRYTFHVQPLDGTWQVAIPGEHTIASEGTLALSVDVTPVAGRVQLVDASGAPLARHFVSVELVGSRQWKSTDDDGEVELELVVGRHRLDLGGPEGTMPMYRGRSVELDWGPAGPSTEVVMVPDVEAK